MTLTLAANMKTNLMVPLCVVSLFIYGALTLPDQAKARLQNPFLHAGGATHDQRPGTVRQGKAGDCFFLAALVALAQAPDVRALIRSAVRPGAHTRLDALLRGLARGVYSLRCVEVPSSAESSL
jgi:hypothetical protein